MQIGITGGAGFIGAALALRLQASGHTVHVIDAFTDYYDVELKLTRAKQLQANGIDVFDGNVHEDLATWCANHSFAALFHLAALPGVPGSLTEPHRYIEDDIAMTVTVLEAARTHGIPHVFFASSSSVYGEQTGALLEQQATGNVMSPYAAAKYSAETFCRTYHNLYDMNVTIFRFFTVYGPSGRPDMALFRFIEQALDGQPLTVFGDPVRDFTYIDDITRGMEQALEAKATGIFNLGANRPESVRDLAAMLSERFNVPVRSAPARIGDVSMTWSNTDAARQTFGYVPSFTLADGIEQMIRWHLERR
ncbi:NAD-dependent epimerase/dehydratase [Exiguobacterium sibiricum 255-15]|uniref:NAD-dependent epimerase/dehydratase n=1 Tax=Exiguobacterium sibiricum (strain DSM 17290 / CCUG 55495 / CIP 109462 / JCM 13490 / 255-15) TaxID=262543 RepID=B1YF52_EXIS2|nr:NAD-dependent epimerase/dehydratase family protein [Exiguobacterium sibiricum]ACB62276.1 NAD-dependent epimerase/dehydratase [Exiguobacterium sibiricum 255-15]